AGACLLSHSGEERPGVFAPALIRTSLVRDQRTRELIDVVGFGNLAEQVPLESRTVEGIQDDIAPARIVEPAHIAIVGVRDDGAVASPERTAENLLHRGALSGARRSNQLEMFRLVSGGNGNAGERHFDRLVRRSPVLRRRGSIPSQST